MIAIGDIYMNSLMGVSSSVFFVISDPLFLVFLNVASVELFFCSRCWIKF